MIEMSTLRKNSTLDVYYFRKTNNRNHKSAKMTVRKDTTRGARYKPGAKNAFGITMAHELSHQDNWYINQNETVK
jgi:hypothetical protein